MKRNVLMLGWLVGLVGIVGIGVGACGPGETTKRATRACEHLAELAKTAGQVSENNKISDCVGMLESMHKTAEETTWNSLVSCVDESKTYVESTACGLPPMAENESSKPSRK